MKTTFLVISMLLIVFYSCNKTSQPVVAGPTPNPKPDSIATSLPDSVISISIDQTKTSYSIPSTFQGLSYEMDLPINDSAYLNTRNTVLVQLLKNLGTGVLRFGGNMSDAVSWSSAPRTSSTPAKTLTPTEVDNISAFAKAVGWKVLFGLNMGVYNPTLAANEASYVVNSFKDNLLAIQFGNEPDGYHSWNPVRTSTYGEPDFETQWNNYFAAVRGQVPGASLGGPDVAYLSSWVASFATNQASNVKLLTAHYYQNGPASDASINVSSLFTPIPQYTNYFQVINNAALSSGVPWRITECNSINGGGKYGVSDVFGSTLWALDFMWQVAINNGQGVNFHGGDGGAYSPIVFYSKNTTVRPLYYSFLAFKYGTDNSIIVPTTFNATPKYKCSAYACKKLGATVPVITLINKEFTQNLTFKIQLTNKATTIHIARLSASSINATTGVTFCKSAVNSNGTFQVGSTEDIAVGGLTSFYVTIPKASAAVVTVE